MQETSLLNHSTGPSEGLTIWRGKYFLFLKEKGLLHQLVMYGVGGVVPLPPAPLPSDAHAMVHHQYVLIEIKTCGSICIQFPLALVVCGF